MSRQDLTATVWVDAETTSLRNPWLPDGRRAWEITLVNDPWPGVPVVGGGPIDLTLTVTDVDLTHADPTSLAMNGWHDRGAPMQGAAEGDKFTGEAALTGSDAVPHASWGPEERIAAYVHGLTGGVVLAAANPGFDVDTFAAMLHRHGMTPQWHYTPFDVKSAAIAAYDLPWDASLRDCVTAAGLDPDAYATHTSRGDVALARDLNVAVRRHTRGAGARS